MKKNMAWIFKHFLCVVVFCATVYWSSIARPQNIECCVELIRKGFRIKHLEDLYDGFSSFVCRSFKWIMQSCADLYDALAGLLFHCFFSRGFKSIMFAIWATVCFYLMNNGGDLLSPAQLLIEGLLLFLAITEFLFKKSSVNKRHEEMRKVYNEHINRFQNVPHTETVVKDSIYLQRAKNRPPKTPWRLRKYLQRDSYPEETKAQRLERIVCVAILLYIKKRKDEALSILLYLVNKGHIRAMKEVANIYAERKEKDSAMLWYSKAAEHGDKEAMHQLGNAYYEGTFGQNNKLEALKWYTKAAENGFAPSMIMMCYIDKTREEYWKKKAAETGYIPGMVLLAMYYSKTTSSEADKKKSISLFEALANRGHPKAMLCLGFAYTRTDLGVNPDNKQAYAWFLLSKKVGYNLMTDSERKENEQVNVLGKLNKTEIFEDIGHNLTHQEKQEARTIMRALQKNIKNRISMKDL